MAAGRGARPRGHLLHLEMDSARPFIYAVWRNLSQCPETRRPIPPDVPKTAVVPVLAIRQPAVSGKTRGCDLLFCARFCPTPFHASDLYALEPAKPALGQILLLRPLGSSDSRRPGRRLP